MLEEIGSIGTNVQVKVVITLKDGIIVVGVIIDIGGGLGGGVGGPGGSFGGSYLLVPRLLSASVVLVQDHSSSWRTLDQTECCVLYCFSH